MESPLTFCITTHNNLNYLKLAVQSLRKYSYFKDAPIIIYSENSTDGTDEWLIGEGKSLYNIESYIEHNQPAVGIGGGMNFCGSKVKTEYIMFLHADMVVSQDWDLKALQLMEYYWPGTLWISSYRIQPNVFNEPNRPGTIFSPLHEFGEHYHNFNEEYFIQYAAKFAELNNAKCFRKGEGVQGLILTQHWRNIGGCDPRFSPQYFEDYDLFVRMQLAGYQFLTTTESVVYHFGSRASRFPDDDLTQRKPELAQNELNSYNKWMEKWGQAPTFDEAGFIKPIQGTNNLINL